MTEDRRRAIRTGIHAGGAVVMIGFLGWIIAITDSHTLIALGLVAILFVREMFHGAENVTARIKFSASAKDGITGEVDPEAIHDGDTVKVEKDT